jgi:acetyl-CoA acyltransferase 2
LFHHQKRMSTPAVYIVAAKRTAFGKFGGTLKNFTAPALGAVAAKGALDSIKLQPELVDSVIWGNVQQSTTDCTYMARHVGLKAGVPIDKPMLTVNRLCGSGFQAIVNGAHEIMLGEAEIVLTGGAESMSMAPMALHGTRWGHPLGQDLVQIDTLWQGLTDLHIKTSMSMTAENLADKLKVTKEQADKWAAISQERWAKAQAAGIFKNEIVPVMVKGKKGDIAFDVDEHPRPDSTYEKLAALRALFKKDGTVSSGNASGICDGAGAVLLASEAAVKKHNLKPLARVVSWAAVGVPPEIMGFGPVPAYRKALQKAGLSIKDMDLCEINEAFASQFIGCATELGLDLEKTNVCGGAVAMGHPTGASGSRIMGHLALELSRRNLKRAIGGACIGGGQGIAVVIERA